MQVTFQQCYNFIDLPLHAIGLILFNIQPLLLLFSLLLNWAICIVLEFMAVKILVKIPWRDLKLRNIPLPKYVTFSALVAIFVMGIINVYSMWGLSMKVRESLLSHPEYNLLIIVPLHWLAVVTAMCHSIILTIYMPILITVVPLDHKSNTSESDINFESDLTLIVNSWLFFHFVYLDISYSHYSIIALLYRLFCTIWLLSYKLNLTGLFSRKDDHDAKNEISVNEIGDPGIIMTGSYSSSHCKSSTSSSSNMNTFLNNHEEKFVMEESTKYPTQCESSSSSNSCESSSSSNSESDSEKTS